MKIYVVTYAHQYDGVIYQNVHLLNTQDEAERVFDSYVEESYENTVGSSVMADDIPLDEYRRDNIRGAWEFDYETGDCTEQYHVEIFEKEIENN